ncbi:hypothetical protein ACJMK2_043777 [Sinanodonta woodiana]|uniref:Uncharacterized protein n=1 Tax=Sinanodonta woodiana TaxID=1069815 RepID=A0ABD3W0R8_SINWO
MLAAIEQQKNSIEKLQKIINDNNETINSLKKIKNLSIFDQIKNELVDDLAANSKDINKGLDKLQSNSIKDDNVPDINKVNETKIIDVVKGAKFDSNWNPQFPE